MPTHVLGFQSHRDKFAIAFSQAEIRNRIQELHDQHVSDDDLKQRYNLQDNKQWQIATARDKLRNRKECEKDIAPCLYRPFDKRYCIFNTIAMDRPRYELLRHVANKTNICLNTVRQTKMATWQHALVADVPTPAVFVEIKEGSSVFPLYLYPDPERPMGEGAVWPAGKNGRRPNLNPEFVRDMEAHLGMTFVTDGKGHLGRTAAVPAAVPGASRPRQGRQDACHTAGEDAGDTAPTFGPEDVFNYTYAVFHSPTYRERYAEFLKIDFPRLPLTADPALFARLCALGAELVGLHLMESPELDHLVTSFPVPGPHLVAKGHPKYLAPGDPEPGTGDPLRRGRVYISKDNAKTNTRGQYFDGVPPEVWEFRVGGYQVCEKWLKDRRGRALSHDDLLRYQKIVVALKETIRIMAEIDAAIPQWPIE